VQTLGWLLLGTAWLAAVYATWRLAAVLSWQPWLQYAATAAVLWLPLWDLIPGAAACHMANRELGGTHLYRTVESDGYLDLRRHSALEIWGTLPASPYRYIEIRSDRRPLTSVSDPAYYQLSLVQRGNPACAAFDESPGAATFRVATGLSNYCPVVVRREQPISRYSVDSSGSWRPVDRYGWSRSLEARWTRIVDRDGLGVLAEAYLFRYTPWLSTLGLDLAIEAHAADTMSETAPDLDPTTVIRPMTQR
jgi:hypothetical protein